MLEVTGAGLLERIPKSGSDEWKGRGDALIPGLDGFAGSFENVIARGYLVWSEPALKAFLLQQVRCEEFSEVLRIQSLSSLRIDSCHADLALGVVDVACCSLLNQQASRGWSTKVMVDDSRVLWNFDS